MAFPMYAPRCYSLRYVFLVFGTIVLTEAVSDYWVANIPRQGKVAFGSDASYKIYRNVQDYGALGNGAHDDTAAINAAISDGNRCGLGCDSSTTTPALIYFPPGMYVVSSPIIMYYFSQLVGDAINPPTLKATAGFIGIAVLDSDVYIPEGNGAEWYTNTNNFYRQVRNFVIDLTAMPVGSGTGIHWQVAQASSLQNIRFEMVQGGGSNNKQQGIFMENGSGGLMVDLVFNGGNYGAFLGNQQFTTRNLTFSNCNTAIYMNFDWVWTFKSLLISNCEIGIDMSNGGINQTVGSVVVLDSKISATTGIVTNYVPGKSAPETAGTLVVENVDFTGSSLAIANSQGSTIVKGGSIIASFGQGNAYTTSSDEANCTNTDFSGTITAREESIQRALTPVQKPANLLDSSGKVFERSKPQYEGLDQSSFLSAKTCNCVGDGVADDTNCVQNFLDQAAQFSKIAYFDHGAYRITSTVNVPTNITITGEVWPMIMADGFTDVANPQAVFKVGNPGDVGAVEISDLVFQTIGPNPGAILVEWNIAASAPGAAGLWDVHWRIGGSAGTMLQSDRCAKNPTVTANANTDCEGAFLLLHVTSQASIYMENTWLWVADHELDRSDHNQVNIFNGRGALIESKNGPVWMYGTASEHNVLYNYQISNAKAVWMGAIQTETAYYQSNPDARQPFSSNPSYSDPTFETCTTPNCIKTWGLRIVDSSEIFIYGTGLYSFFDNYGQTCLDTESCQLNMVDLTNSSDVYMWATSTKASTYMVTFNDQGLVPQAPNDNTFCQTIVLFEAAACNGVLSGSNGTSPASVSAPSPNAVQQPNAEQPGNSPAASNNAAPPNPPHTAPVAPPNPVQSNTQPRPPSDPRPLAGSVAPVLPPSVTVPPVPVVPDPAISVFSTTNDGTVSIISIWASCLPTSTPEMLLEVGRYFNSTNFD